MRSPSAAAAALNDQQKRGRVNHSSLRSHARANDLLEPPEAALRGRSFFLAELFWSFFLAELLVANSGSGRGWRMELGAIDDDDDDVGGRRRGASYGVIDNSSEILQH